MRKLSHYNSIFLRLLLLSWMVSGCAAHQTHDPFEKFNRGVFAFNDGVDKIMLKPIAETYKAVVPEPVDNGVTNFFSNLNDIGVVVNDLLQFKFKQALSDTGRLFLNTTAGLLGFIDVGTELGLSKHNEDFGQTLGFWGVKKGPYLVLPFFGPSSGRDVVGFGTDLLFDPTFYYAASITSTTGQAVFAGGAIKGVDTRADLLGTEQILQTAALDKYLYIREAYLARRKYLVYDGNPPEEEDFFDEEDLFEEEEDLLNELDEEDEEDLLDELDNDEAEVDDEKVNDETAAPENEEKD